MIRALTVFAVIAALATAARADIISGGDFESGGTPSGFATFGNASVVSSVGSGAVLPGAGSSFLQASTGPGTGAGVAIGTGPASFFTGDPAGTGVPLTNGEYSGFSFSLSVPVASIFSFLVNVETSEASGVITAPDLVAVYVDSGSGAVPLVGAAINASGTLNSPFGNIAAGDFDGSSITDGTFGTFDDGQIGWDTVSAPIAPGSYTVYFLVGDAGDQSADTGVSVDNLSLAPVPEPGTWLLFGAGALGLVGYRRFRLVRSR